MAGQTEWLAELRRLTVLFAGIEAPMQQPALQQVWEIAQESLLPLDAGLDSFQIDDKGLVLIGLLGLPPWTHDDDPVRGLLAAQRLVGALQQAGFRARCGVTTGRVFCGPIGSRRRRTFSILGDTVNLAARLMAEAEDVLCDAATARAARSRVVLDPLPPRALKGKAAPVEMWRPRGEQRTATPHSLLVGRERERDALLEALHGVQQGRGAAIVLEGEAGIGKSRLLGELRESAEQCSLRVVEGAGSTVEHASPYHVWRHILRSLLEPDEDLRLRLPEPALAPLLNDVLQLQLEETDPTRALQGTERAERTRQVLLALLGNLARERPAVLLLEDAHWFDAASSEVLAMACQAIENVPVLLAVSTRPDALPPLPGARVCRLQALSAPETAALVRSRLQADEVAEEIMAFITARAGGNPFFTEELLHAVEEAGVLRREDGRIALVGPLASLSVPETLEGIVVSRIDRLPAAPQLTLKTASVIGRSFPVQVLSDIHPIPHDRPQVPGHLTVLEQRDFAHPESAEAYLFKHVTTQEVAYNLLPFAQRRALHRAIAQHYEKAPHADYSVLAWHWEKAEVPEHARRCWALSGEHALRAGLCREAIDHLTRAIKLSAGQPYPACWERWLGEAWLGLGNTAESRQHFERALQRLGVRIPHNPAERALRLLGQVAKQTLHRLSPVPIPCPSDRDREVVRESVLCFEPLAQIAWHDHRLNDAMRYTLSGMNQLERLGASADLARVMGLSAVGCASSGQQQLSRFYSRRAIEMARQLDDVAAICWVQLLRGIADVGAGRVAAARQELQEATELAEQLGHARRWEEAAATLGGALLHLGRYTETAALLARIKASAIATGNLQARAWSVYLSGSLSLYQQQPVTVKDEATELRHTEHLALHDRMCVMGVLIGAHRVDGEWDAAMAVVQEAREALGCHSPSGFLLFPAYSETCALALERWEREGPRWRREARRALADLGAFAARFPLAGPRWWYYRGQFARLAGRPLEAQHFLSRARALGQRQQMPYEIQRSNQAMVEAHSSFQSDSRMK
ncbi:MAG: ATP-binding protein [Candidatus Xenobia bacterium]